MFAPKWFCQLNIYFELTSIEFMNQESTNSLNPGIFFPCIDLVEKYTTPLDKWLFLLLP